MTLCIHSTRVLHALMGALVLGAGASLGQAQSSQLPRIPLEPNEPSDVRSGMAFGATVAIGKGGQAFVGAPGTDGHGAVYVFQQQGSKWVRAQKLVAPDMTPTQFGDRLASDQLSGVMISDTQRGRVYWFESDSRTGALRAKAVLTGGVEQFGTAAAVEGCTAFIASGGGTTQPTGAGYVHVYNRCPSGTWSYIGSFQAPDARAQDLFGYSLGFTGTDLLVGAPGRDNSTGAVYRYAFVPGSGRTNWKFVQKITQAHAAAGNRFGTSVSLKGGLAILSAPGTVTGEVDVYKRDANKNWLYSSTIANPDTTFDAFGFKVLVTFERVLISTDMNPFSLKIPGSLYVYRRGAGDALTLEEHLVQNNSSDDTFFASAFDNSGRALVIGEPGRFVDLGNNGPPVRSGGADVYVLPAPPN
jgi:hypothetical protein